MRPYRHKHSAQPREMAGERLGRGGLLNEHQLFALKRPPPAFPSAQKHSLGNSRLGEAGISAGIGADHSVRTLTGHGSRPRASLLTFAGHSFFQLISLLQLEQKGV